MIQPAAANMATFPLLIACLFFGKQLVEGITRSGLKEAHRRNIRVLAAR